VHEVAVAFGFAEHGWQAVPHELVVLVSRQIPSGQLNLLFAQNPLQERFMSMQTLLQICWLFEQPGEHWPPLQLVVPPAGATQAWPHVPQFCESVFVFAPPLHADHPDHVPLLQVLVWLPVQLHVCVVGPLQEHEVQWQSAPQLCEPPAVPQVCVAFGEQTPSPVH
jgi:hypothetical protein